MSNLTTQPGLWSDSPDLTSRNTNGSELSSTSPLSTTLSSNITCPSAVTSASANIFFMVYYSLVFLVGLLLNGFTLKVYFFTPRQKTSSGMTVYLKNLAAADFLISLCLPMRISSLATKITVFGKLHCYFGASIFYLNIYTSILFMGYIAAHRYLKIVHHSETNFLHTVRGARIISTITWAVLLVLAITFTILASVTSSHLKDFTKNSCHSLLSKEIGIFYKVIHPISATIFLVVLVCLVFFYYITSRRLSLALQKQPASYTSRKLVRSRRTMLVLVIVFCVCFVPYHLVRVPYIFLNCSAKWKLLLTYLKELTIMLSVLNICLDPLIYFIFCKDFRATLRIGKMFSTMDTTMHTDKIERRSSNRRTAIRINRNTSFSMTTQNKVL